MSEYLRQQIVFEASCLRGIEGVCVCSDWSDWQAHPVSAVCLFCDHQSETMEQIYTHMKVQTQEGSELPHIRSLQQIHF